MKDLTGEWLSHPNISGLDSIKDQDFTFFRLIDADTGKEMECRLPNCDYSRMENYERIDWPNADFIWLDNYH